MRECQPFTREPSPARTVESSHGSDISPAVTPSSQSINSNVTDSNDQTPTSSKSGYGVFANQTSLEMFLLQNTKSKSHMMRLKTGAYGISERQSITYVTAAKVIDCYGHYPPKDKLKLISIYLAGITGLTPEDFFEPKSHKGFLAKCIENARIKLNSSEKRWTWAPKEERTKKHPNMAQSTTSQSDAPCSSSSLTSIVLQDDEFIFTGCCRGLEECEFCEGKTRERKKN